MHMTNDASSGNKRHGGGGGAGHQSDCQSSLRDGAGCGTRHDTTGAGYRTSPRMGGGTGGGLTDEDVEAND